MRIVLRRSQPRVTQCRRGKMMNRVKAQLCLLPRPQVQLGNENKARKKTSPQVSVFYTNNGAPSPASMTGWHPRLFDIIALQLLPQGLAVDPQGPGGFALMAFTALQGVEDVVPLQVLQGSRPGFHPGRQDGSGKGEVGGPQVRPG